MTDAEKIRWFRQVSKSITHRLAAFVSRLTGVAFEHLMPVALFITIAYFKADRAHINSIICGHGLPPKNDGEDK